MTTDLPDYTRKIVIEYSGGFIGLEELATRLGFIAPFNLQGNLVLAEDFETEAVEWDLTIVGGVGVASRSSRRKYSGNWSIKLAIPATADAYATPTRHIHFPGVVKYGLFGRFCFTNDCQKIWMEALFEEGATEYKVGLRYDFQNTTLELWDSTEAYVTFDTDLNLWSDVGCWYPFLLTFDLKEKVFDKLFVGATEYDLSSYGVANQANVEPVHAELSFGALTPSDDAFTCYFDDLVLVKNVP